MAHIIGPPYVMDVVPASEAGIATHHLFQPIQHHITDDGRDDTALRHSRRGRIESPALDKAALEPLRQHLLVHRYVFLDPREADVVEKALDIPFQDPAGRVLLS